MPNRIDATREAEIRRTAADIRRIIAWTGDINFLLRQLDEAREESATRARILEQAAGAIEYAQEYHGRLKGRDEIIAVIRAALAKGSGS